MQRDIIKGILLEGDKKRVEWGRLRNRRHSRGIFFIPPLIGGHLTQQIKMFRRLSQQHYDIITYNYSGHGQSSDKFSLQATLHDTLCMLRHALEIGQQEELPLHGIASCYAAIPMLYAADQTHEPLKSLVLINAIPSLNLWAAFKAFGMYSRLTLTKGPSLQGIQAAIENYLNFLFPQVIKNGYRFGSLERRRAGVLKIIYESLALNPLRHVQLNQTPVLCLYGRQDRILNLYAADSDAGYQQSIQKLCPQARFQAMDGDHFLSGKDIRARALQSILDFLNENLVAYDRRCVLRV
jgi:pimeloyl-ACP methyl ester carboxylesterase